MLAQALRSVVSDCGGASCDRQYIIDGTLLPCWSWTAVPGLWSGKHRTTGVVVQVAAHTLEGQLSGISDPTPGSRHDLHLPRPIRRPRPPRTYPRSAIKDTSGAAFSPRSKNNPAGKLSTGRKHSTRASTHTRAPSSESSAHIKSWKKFSTQTTARPTPHLKRRSRQSSDSSSTHLPDGA